MKRDDYVRDFVLLGYTKQEAESLADCAMKFYDPRFVNFLLEALRLTLVVLFGFAAYGYSKHGK